MSLNEPNMMLSLKSGSNNKSNKLTNLTYRTISYVRVGPVKSKVVKSSK